MERLGPPPTSDPLPASRADTMTEWRKTQRLKNDLAGGFVGCRASRS